MMANSLSSYCQPKRSTLYRVLTIATSTPVVHDQSSNFHDAGPTTSRLTIEYETASGHVGGNPALV